MAEHFELQTDQTPTSDQPNRRVDFADAHHSADTFDVDLAAFQRLDLSGSELITSSSEQIRLNLDSLKSFEKVDNQFQDWGVTFSNAIALHPSNPAYPCKSGRTVLMGTPKDGWLEAKFRKPVRSVSSCVTSSRCTVLSAFDENDQPVAQTESTGANLAGSNSQIAPNVKLNLTAQRIHRVTFHALGGQLTLGEFGFSF